MPKPLIDEQSEFVRLNVCGIDVACRILEERKCYGRIKEEIPAIKKELRESGKYTAEEIDAIIFRLENIACPP